MAQGRAHLDQAVALYDPAQHRPLGLRFGKDIRVATLAYRAMALWMLGYPKAALADVDQLLSDAGEIGQAATVMYALFHAAYFYLCQGNYQAVITLSKEAVALAEEKGTLMWKGGGITLQGCASALTGNASDAVQMITTGIGLLRATGARFWIPLFRLHLAKAHSELGQFDTAWGGIREVVAVIENSKETWWEAEVNRIAGEIARKSDDDGLKAEKYFERALTVARQQQAKSWELRASMSLARLWRDQGKVQQARELLAPVYGWFSEGFDTRDLKEAKELLGELA
jgi:predicted ATPase